MPSDREKPMDRYGYEKTSKIGIDRGYEKTPTAPTAMNTDKHFSGISSKK